MDRHCHESTGLSRYAAYSGAVLLILDCMTQFLECFTIDICSDCGTFRQEVYKEMPFLSPMMCAHHIQNGKCCFKCCLCFDEACVYFMNCCFNLGVLCNNHVLFPVSIQLHLCWLLSIFSLRVRTISDSSDLQTKFYEEINVKFVENARKVM